MVEQWKNISRNSHTYSTLTYLTTTRTIFEHRDSEIRNWVSIWSPTSRKTSTRAPSFRITAPQTQPSQSFRTMSQSINSFICWWNLASTPLCSLSMSTSETKSTSVWTWPIRNLSRRRQTIASCDTDSTWSSCVGRTRMWTMARS